MNGKKLRVVAGPYRNARRYAVKMGWPEDEFVIVTRAHQLAGLDPKLITTIIIVNVHALSAKIKAEIDEEIAMLKALWPVPTVAA